MKPVWRMIRPLYAPLAVLVLHALALELLYRADVLSELLGTTSPNVAAAFALALYYVLRIVAIFICPGWLLFALARVVMDLRSPTAPGK